MEFTISGSVDDERIFDNFATKWLVADLVTPRNRVPSIAKYSMLTPSPARARLWIRVRATTFLSPGPCRANQAASRARSIGFPRATFFQLSDISQLLHSNDCEFQLFWCKFSLCFPGPIWDRSRSEEHPTELQSLMRISHAVSSLSNKTHPTRN